MKLEMLRSLQNSHRAALALQAVRAKIRGKLPGRGRFKIMDESTAGSDSDSAPPSSRRGSQPKGVIFAEGVRGKTGSLDGRCGTVTTISEKVMSLPKRRDSVDRRITLAAVLHQQTDIMNEHMQCHLSDALSAAVEGRMLLLPSSRSQDSELEGPCNEHTQQCWGSMAERSLMLCPSCGGC